MPDNWLRRLDGSCFSLVQHKVVVILWFLRFDFVGHNEWFRDVRPQGWGWWELFRHVCGNVCLGPHHEIIVKLGAVGVAVGLEMAGSDFEGEFVH